MLLMRPKDRSKALSLKLPLPAKLLARFMRIFVVLIIIVSVVVVAPSMAGRRAITIPAGKNHGRQSGWDDGASFPRLALPVGGGSAAAVRPQHGAERARFHDIAVICTASGRMAGIRRRAPLAVEAVLPSLSERTNGNEVPAREVLQVLARIARSSLSYRLWAGQGALIGRVGVQERRFEYIIKANRFSCWHLR